MSLQKLQEQGTRVYVHGLQVHQIHWQSAAREERQLGRDTHTRTHNLDVQAKVSSSLSLCVSESAHGQLESSSWSSTLPTTSVTLDCSLAQVTAATESLGRYNSLKGTQRRKCNFYLASLFLFLSLCSSLADKCQVSFPLSSLDPSSILLFSPHCFTFSSPPNATYKHIISSFLRDLIFIQLSHSLNWLKCSSDYFLLSLALLVVLSFITFFFSPLFFLYHTERAYNRKCERTTSLSLSPGVNSSLQTPWHKKRRKVHTQTHTQSATVRKRKQIYSHHRFFFFSLSLFPNAINVTPLAEEQSNYKCQVLLCVSLETLGNLISAINFVSSIYTGVSTPRLTILLHLPLIVSPRVTCFHHVKKTNSSLNSRLVTYSISKFLRRHQQQLEKAAKFIYHWPVYSMYFTFNTFISTVWMCVCAMIIEIDPIDSVDVHTCIWMFIWMCLKSAGQGSTSAQRKILATKEEEKEEEKEK